jgi:hypothetical protein
MVVVNFSPDTISFTYKCTGANNEYVGGTLEPLTFNAFKPVGGAPYTIDITGSAGFTIHGIKNPSSVVFCNYGWNPQYKVVDPAGA